MFKHGSKNRAFRLVWNADQDSYVPAPESSRARGKRATGSVTVVGAAVAALLSSGAAHAVDPMTQPTGGVVTGGQASISQSIATTTVQQGSARAAIDWQSFSVGSQASVNFVQPSATAVILNRVVGQDPTQVLGRINANGQVFIVNPSGVLFAPGAQVNAAGILASTRDISVSDFMADKLVLSGSSTAGVVNRGSLTAANGGYIVLVGAQIVNEGSLSAPLGDVRLAAADRVTLRIDNGGLASFNVDRGTLDGLVANKGAIRADGGRIYLTADALDALARAVVNNEGIVEALTVNNHAGTIVLQGDMKVGTTIVGGTLDASAPNGGDGGFIETSAAHVKLADGHRVTTSAATGTTGRWLIDPTDFTIAASGGDTTGTQLSSDLATSNITIQSTLASTGTAGDIHVNDVVAWSAHQLTLNAQGNIDVNANLLGSGSASLALVYGQSAASAGNTSVYKLADGVRIDLPTGNTFSTTQGSDGVAKSFYVINSLGAEGSVTGTDLQGMQNSLGGHYALGADISAAATATWNSGAGFATIGSDGNPFSGTLEGLGHAIDGLTVVRQTATVGMFGATSGDARIANLALTNVSITNTTGSYSTTGGLVGSNNGLIDHVSVSGTVGNAGGQSTGGLVGLNNGTIQDSKAVDIVVVAPDGDFVGGLVGNHSSGSILRSTSSGSVTGASDVGGLVGLSYVSLDGLSSSANVTGSSDQVGGLVGYMQEGSITHSFASGNVAGVSKVGGLVGKAQDVSDSHATGAVVGQNKVGGLTGTGLSVTDSYATGAVNGSGKVGGLVGNTKVGGIVSGSHASGNVTGTANDTGGLVGENDGTVTGNSYSTGVVIGHWSVGGLVGYNSNNATVDTAHTGNLGTAQPAVSGLDSVGGLVGSNSGTISNSVATGAVISTGNGAGGLVGLASTGTISQSSASGAVSGFNAVGGFVGIASSSTTFTQNQAIGAASGDSQVGGFVGRNDTTISGNAVDGNRGTGAVTGNANQGSGGIGGFAGSNTGTLTDIVATNSVAETAGAINVGGVVGFNDGGTVARSSFSGVVSSNGNNVGGLVGGNFGGAISTSYSTGSVTGSGNVGGLVGDNAGTVSVAYSSASVTGQFEVGGLIGLQDAAGDTQNAYATGSVLGDSFVGGFFGMMSGSASHTYSNGTVSLTGQSIAPNVGAYAGVSVHATIADSYFDTQSSGRSTAIGGFALTTGMAVGKTTAEMNSAATFAGWDLASTGGAGLTWRSYDGLAAPLLTYWLTALTMTGSGGAITQVYDGTVHSQASNLTYTETLAPGHLLGSVGYVGGKNVGVYATLGGGYSDQQGYDISYAAPATLTITPAALTLALTGVTKVYDGTTAATLAAGNFQFSGFAVGEGATVATTAGTFDSKNVRDATRVSANVAAGDIGAQGGTLLSNYTLPTQASGAATITAKTIAVTATGANSKVFDGTTLATGASLATTGFVGGDSASLAVTSAAFADANAGVAKTVTVAGVVTGADASNYAIAGSATTTADITAAPPPVVTPPVAAPPVANPPVVTPPAPAPATPISTQTPTPTLASALVSLPNLPSGFDLASALTLGTPSAIDATLRTPIAADSVKTTDDATRLVSVVSNNTRENLNFRRTFAIGDGGMRLPAGVAGSDKDAAP